MKRPDILAQKARYSANESIQVYTIFDGWQDATIERIGWDTACGRVQYYIVTVSGARWITNESNMRKLPVS